MTQRKTKTFKAELKDPINTWHFEILETYSAGKITGARLFIWKNESDRYLSNAWETHGFKTTNEAIAFIAKVAMEF